PQLQYLQIAHSVTCHNHKQRNANYLVQGGAVGKTTQKNGTEKVDAHKGKGYATQGIENFVEQRKVIGSAVHAVEHVTCHKIQQQIEFLNLFLDKLVQQHKNNHYTAPDCGVQNTLPSERYRRCNAYRRSQKRVDGIHRTDKQSEGQRP